jgi:small subunit ribosomal protein S16
VVKIRMKRMGRRHRPFYRINAMDTRSPRDGRVVEELGFYDPIAADQEKQLKINEERVRYWLDKGAATSETVHNLLKSKGIIAK